MTTVLKTSLSDDYQLSFSLSEEEKTNLFTKLPGLVNEVTGSPFGRRFKIKTSIWNELPNSSLGTGLVFELTLSEDDDEIEISSPKVISKEAILSVLEALYSAYSRPTGDFVPLRTVSSASPKSIAIDTVNAIITAMKTYVKEGITTYTIRF